MTDDNKMGRPVGSGSWLPPVPKQTRQERAADMRDKRNSTILEAAVKLAEDEGYQWITRDMVARAAGVSVGSVNNAFGRMIELKRAVMAEAVKREIVSIVVQGLADGSAIAANAPLELKQRAAAFVSS